GVEVIDPMTDTPVFVDGHPGNPGNTGLTVSSEGELEAIEPGATAYFRASAVIEEADVVDGVVHNIASASATSAGGAVSTESFTSNEVEIAIITPPTAPSHQATVP